MTGKEVYELCKSIKSVEIYTLTGEDEDDPTDYTVCYITELWKDWHVPGPLGTICLRMSDGFENHDIECSIHPDGTLTEGFFFDDTELKKIIRENLKKKLDQLDKG